jgi:hypothetical protein
MGVKPGHSHYGRGGGITEDIRGHSRGDNIGSLEEEEIEDYVMRGAKFVLLA